MLLFLLTGCGTRQTGVTEAPVDKPNAAISQEPDRVQLQGLTGQDKWYNWSLAHVEMPNGKTVTCIKVDSKGDSPVSISCDWVGFHQTQETTTTP